MSEHVPIIPKMLYNGFMKSLCLINTISDSFEPLTAISGKKSTTFW